MSSVTSLRSPRHTETRRRWPALILPALLAAVAVALFYLPLEGSTHGIFEFERFWTFDYILFLAFVLGLPVLLMPRDGGGQVPALVFFTLAYVVTVATHLPAFEEAESTTRYLAVALALPLLLLIAAGLVRARSSHARIVLPILGGASLLLVLVLLALAYEGKLGERFSELSDPAGTIALFGALLILLVFLTLSASRWSRGVRVAVILFSLAYFGFLQAACPRLPGAIELTLLHLSEPAQAGMHILKVGVVLVMGLVFGRYYCGWICPKGVIQELIYRPRFKVKVPEKVDRVLKLGKYLTLILLILFPLLLEIRLFRHIGPFRVIFNLMGPAYLIIFLLVVLATSVFIERAYCRYFCPEGGLLALAQLLSPYRMRFHRESCNCCGRCIKACPVDAFVTEGKGPLRISRTECIVCKECERVCRQGSIHYDPWFTSAPAAAEAGGAEAAGECLDDEPERKD